MGVKTATIPASTICRLSIYLRNAESGEYCLYRHGDMPLEAGDLERLRAGGIETIHLDAGDYCRYQEQLRASLDSALQDETQSVPERFGVLNEVVRGSLREVFRSKNVDRAVQESQKLANHVVDMILHDDFVASELTTVLHYDYGTFTHCANVAYYSVILAQGLTFRDRGELARIGTGALLHDVGKVEVPDYILTKPGPLTAAEMKTMRRHPGAGLLSLRHHDELDFGQLMMVYQHHERIDGTGYPVRVLGNEIHDWARIVAVADVFEALTSQRPYRRPLTPAAALDLMEETAEGLDQEFLRCWKATISKS